MTPLSVEPTQGASRRCSAPDVTADVLRRWSAGHDSAAIAAALSVPEADVCRIVAADQERRYRARTLAAPFT